MLWFSLLVLIPLAMVVATAGPRGWGVLATCITNSADLLGACS
jgi:hypothetical protein